MRRFLAVGIVAVLLLGVYSALPGQQPARATGAGKNWEYRLVLLRELHGDKGTEVERVKSAEVAFNEYGKEGWEYAGQVSSGVLFKRAR
jgi:hypothetical protein